MDAICLLLIILLIILAVLLATTMYNSLSENVLHIFRGGFDIVANSIAEKLIPKLHASIQNYQQ